MRYGWRGLGLPDQRDEAFRYKSVVPCLAEVPKVVDLICAPVVDQGDLGSCVFFALSYALEAAQVEHDQIPINPSQLFAYYQYRSQYGNIEYDEGAFIRDAIKTYSQGVCLEDDWPYLLANFSRRPTYQAYQAAKAHRIQSYHAFEDLEDMIQSIASGYGFVGGISVYESFESAITTGIGVVNLPEPHEKLLGGHALYFCGYDLHQQAFKLQNSWGTAWGHNGFGWIPFEYLTNPRLAGDFWCVMG